VIGPAVLLAGLAVAYGAGLWSLRRRRRPWRARRTAAFAAGLLVLGAALLSPLAAQDDRFPAHVAQHMLLGMLGPLLLSLSAPVSLALRTLPPAPRSELVRLLHSRVAGVAAHPVSATALFVGGLVSLYFTPLYEATLRSPLLHEVVHVHFLAAGCLFAWTFVGSDPVPRRGGAGLRIGLLLVALGAHAAIAKLLYAGYGELPSVPVSERHAGAQLMYYAGDLVDALVLIVFFGRWYVAGGRRLRQAGTGVRVTAP
jgi:putative membrane protein